MEAGRAGRGQRRLAWRRAGCGAAEVAGDRPCGGGLVWGSDAGDSGWVTEWPGEEHGALGGSTLSVWCGARLGVAWLRVPSRVPGRNLRIEASTGWVGWTRLMGNLHGFRGHGVRTCGLELRVDSE